MDAAVDHQPLDLVEHRGVGGVAVAAIDAARRDDADRRRLRSHRADLHRRGVGAKHQRALVLALDVESILHRPRRMVLGHVERGEIVPVVLDLGPLGDREAEVRENLGELVHHLAHGMDRADGRFGRGEREVDPLGRQLALQLGGFERGLALGDGGGHRLAQRVDRRALLRRAPPGSSGRATSAARSPNPTCRASPRAALRAHPGRAHRQCRKGSRPGPWSAASSRAAPQNAKVANGGCRWRVEWPILDPERDGETFAVLHLASQMLGKIRLRHSTWENHGWHLTLRPRADGVAILPTAAGDGRSFTLGARPVRPRDRAQGQRRCARAAALCRPHHRASSVTVSSRCSKAIGLPRIQRNAQRSRRRGGLRRGRSPASLRSRERGAAAPGIEPASCRCSSASARALRARAARCIFSGAASISP